PVDAHGRRVEARDPRRTRPRARGSRDERERDEREDRVPRHAPAHARGRLHRDHWRDDRRVGMTLLRMFLVQTKMHFVWYFRRDGEMIFWTLVMPVFFLVLFSYAFSDGTTSRSSA